jgi:hypothetical protein
MPRKKLPRNAPCPCGSGKNYGCCCYGNEFEYLVDDDGNVFKSIPLSDVRAMVPLPDNSSVAVVEYEHLLTLESMGVTEFVPQGAKRKYSVAELLDGIEDLWMTPDYWEPVCRTHWNDVKDRFRLIPCHAGKIEWETGG